MAHEELTFAWVLWVGRWGSKHRLRELDMGKSKVSSSKVGDYISFPGTVPLYVSFFLGHGFETQSQTLPLGNIIFASYSNFAICRSDFVTFVYLCTNFVWDRFF